MSKSIKANTFFKTLMSIANIIFPLITTPYVVRILSVDGFTEYNKAMSMLAWFSPFAVFGVYTYGMRSISQIKKNKELVSKLYTNLFCFNVGSSVIVTVIYIAVVKLLPSLSEWQSVYLLVGVQLLFVCFATDWANEAFEHYGFILIKTFICRFVYVISVFLFVRDQDDVVIYVLLSSISVIINNVFTFAYSKYHINFVSTTVTAVIKYVRPLFTVFLLVNASMLYTVFDRFVLAWFGDKISLTYYTMTQAIIVSITGVTSSVILVSIPRLTHYWSEKKYIDYHKTLKKTVAFFLGIHTPCCIGLMLLSWEAMYFYSGYKYIESWSTLCLFSVRYYISAYDMIVSKQVLLASGNEKSLTRIYYIGGIYNIICKIVLVLLNKLSPQLCVLTTASADILVVVLQIIQAKKLKLINKVYSEDGLKYFFISLIFVPVVLFIRKIIGTDSFYRILAETTISIVICIGMYLLALSILKDDLVKLVRGFGRNK